MLKEVFVYINFQFYHILIIYIESNLKFPNVDKNERIKDIKFKTFGCAAAIATASMLTVLAKGKKISEAEKLTMKDIAKSLKGLPPLKMHCSDMAINALRLAIKDYEDKNGK